MVFFRGVAFLMPRPQKPPERRQRHGSTTDARDLKVVDMAAQVEPPAPRRRWRKWTKEGWKAYWRDPISNAVREPDLPGLYRLHDMKDAVTKLWEVLDEDGPIVAGSKGQTRTHPAFDKILALSETIL